LLECSLVKVNQPAPRTMDSIHVPTGLAVRPGCWLFAKNHGSVDRSPPRAKRVIGTAGMAW